MLIFVKKKAENLNHKEALVRSQSSAILNVYLILARDSEILLSLRKNTGYYDGHYSLVAGHVEEGESATTALVRETKEEIGISILPKDLKVVHVMHRKTNRNNVDVFFACHFWDFDPSNKEPEKCADLKFCAFDALPLKIIPYIASALGAYVNGLYYSEVGYIGTTHC